MRLKEIAGLNTYIIAFYINTWTLFTETVYGQSSPDADSILLLVLNSWHEETDSYNQLL